MKKCILFLFLPMVFFGCQQMLDISDEEKESIEKAINVFLMDEYWGYESLSFYDYEKRFSNYEENEDMYNNVRRSDFTSPMYIVKHRYKVGIYEYADVFYVNSRYEVVYWGD